MKSELIVDVRPSEISIALLEEGRLVSLQKEARNISYAVGDIYLAKVKKLMPALNAAFVNVGYEKDAFLHYLDLGPHFTSYAKYLDKAWANKKEVPLLSKMELLPEIDKHGTITDLLQCGKELLVQIVKEPISSKGPRLTTELSFTGRFMVLIPFCDKISISQKIKSQEERSRLKGLVSSIKPKNFGIIIRTSAEGKRAAELNTELENLLESWKQTVVKAQKSTAPSLIFQEESRILSVLRDLFSSDFESIYVNDAEIYRQIVNFVNQIAPDSRDIVKLYTKETPIFDNFAITKQIKSSFGKTVSFKSGSYIIIEHTEALHVIDVNSGNRAKGAPDQESNALEVNLRAADEIARQLRLRDMGGIIVIDFIDMNKNEHRQKLYEHMREIMANDRARHNILPLSKFGLMQITRQRVRPVLDITVTETCPSCFGKGEVQPSLLFTDKLYEKIEYLIKDLGQKKFAVYVHPFVEAYIKKGLFNSIYRKWHRSLGRNFKIIADQSLAYLQYRVIDSEGNEIDLREEKDVNSTTAAKAQNRLTARALEEDESSEKENRTDSSKVPVKKESGSTALKEKAQRLQKKAEAREKIAEAKIAEQQAAEVVAAIEKDPTLLNPKGPESENKDLSLKDRSITNNNSNSNPNPRQKKAPLALLPASAEQTSDKAPIKKSDEGTSTIPTQPVPREESAVEVKASEPEKNSETTPEKAEAKETTIGSKKRKNPASRQTKPKEPDVAPVNDDAETKLQPRKSAKAFKATNPMGQDSKNQGEVSVSKEKATSSEAVEREANNVTERQPGTEAPTNKEVSASEHKPISARIRRQPKRGPVKVTMDLRPGNQQETNSQI